jgi:hypothetical protein
MSGAEIDGLEIQTPTRTTSRRQMNRKPSCLISCAHCGPDGTALPSIGSPIIAAMILTPIFVEAISSRGPAASRQKKGPVCGQYKQCFVAA